MSKNLFFESVDPSSVTEETIGDVVKTMRAKVTARATADKRFLVTAAYAVMHYTRVTGENHVKFAKATGANGSTALQWARVGSLLALGVEPGSDLWKLSTPVVNSKPVATILDGKGRDGNGENVPVTEEDLQWALGILLKTDADGNFAGGKFSAAEVKSRIAADLGVEEEEETPEEARKVFVKRFTENVNFVAANVDKMDADLFAALAEDLATISRAARVLFEQSAKQANDAEVARIAS